MRERLHTGLVVAVLLLVGALLGSGLLEWGDRRQTESTDPAPAFERREGVSVEVLNGTDASGAAARVSERLREMGFDVKTFGNAEDFAGASSVLLDRSGRTRAVESLSEALGGVPIRTDPAPELYLDATLILGPDWERLLPR